ncbi:telomere-associated protein RIF1 isoform X2 [Electrophorus electricus]|uniref:telomere-associated protein RIF1 isoform X2 n=1 Tax=Electrophorus electricus TaxID=8005 RepID=UPI0015D0AC2A|nr:telomere-associated protein RIF1 isoform X2 [Electrophorus electricus]
MMATVPLSSSSLLPLLESLEDTTAGVSEQTDAYLTIANRLSGEDGRQFFPIIVKHFSRLGKAFQTHISSENEELSQAALQALGFCVFNTNIVSGIPANFAEEILSVLCALVLKSTDKNTCTRALWVISKQNFPAEVVSKKTPEILKTLDSMQTKDIQSILMDHESLNVVIKLLEQAPPQMTEGATCWAKLIIPLVVHSASKVRLRAAAALEMGMPLLLEKQMEVAAIVEPMMSSKLIPEMQKLFSTKNESNVLKLWPLFVRLLGKLLHKGGAFINSLLYLEELGFRSSSPSIKKIAFIAWKSLIDNFALNPDILCSSKRLKLLMQPLSSILVRTEALLLTKLEVWWYLVVKLGPNLAANFDQVGVPLLHCTLPPDASLQSSVTPARGASQSNGIALSTPKAVSGVPSCSSPGATPRASLGSSMNLPQSYTSIQLLGLEMLLHYFLGSQAAAAGAKSKLQLSLEPLTHNLLSSHSFFSKHASTLILAVRDGFITVGKSAPEALLSLIWNSLVNLVSTVIEAAGNKKERQGSEVLTLLLQTLQAILCSEALPIPRALLLLEATVMGIPQKVLGSAAYQVANMDVLNGTPALFLILLIYNNSLLSSFVADERFFQCLETLVSCGLSGPTSPLAFGESVLGAVSHSVEAVENREHLWRMWSVMVNPLTDTITQTNEVNQGDALEHNFSAIHSALMFPVTHLLCGSALPQMTQKSMLSTWSRLYKAFARCSALVATAEENVCCEELCSRISVTLDGQTLKNLSHLDGIANILLFIIESVDFSPFTPQFQQKMKSPRTPLGRVRKRSKALGNLSSFHVLLLQALEAFLNLNSSEENSVVLSSLGSTLISIVCSLFNNLSLPIAIQESLACLIKPLALFYGQEVSSDCEQSHPLLGSKLEKLLSEMLCCLQTRSALQYDDELLAVLSPLLCVLFPHKSKQIRSVITQFWNATFGNTLILTYPEMLKPVLSQAKQKAPLILPGFQGVETSEDYSGQCSSECSQLDAEISGIKVASVGKRESLLARAAELKERSSAGPTKPVSVPRREVLEEAASVDFVFIPPEAKERVLTEHQKEVKRTKRVDIPTMYNNLDASLDTTIFAQYTQSQEESLDTLPADEQAETNKVSTVETGRLETEESFISGIQEAQDNISLETKTPEKETNQTTEISLSADLSVSDVDEHDSAKKSDGQDVSGSSDMISGTPPKPSSRRQSFITLEKYAEGRPVSPMSVTKFTGPLTRTSYSQDTPKSQQLTPDGSYCSLPEKDEGLSQAFARNMSQDSTQKSEEKDTELKADLQPVPLHSSEGIIDDVIPDTQSHDLNVTGNGGEKCLHKSNLEVETEIASLGEDSEAVAASSQVEPRRSGRRRSRPVRPGEESTDQGSKNKQQKRHSVNELTLTDAQKPSPSKRMDSVLPGRSRRSKVLEESNSENGRSQNSERKDEHSQTDSQALAVISATGLSQGRSRRNKTRELSQSELANDKQFPLSQTENRRESPFSQSHSRLLRRTRVVSTIVEILGKRQRVENSQSDSLANMSMLKGKNVDTQSSDSEVCGQSPGRPKRMKKSEMHNTQNKDQPVIENDPSQSDSQTVIPVKGRVGRRKKVRKTSASRDTTPSSFLSTECSLSDEMQDSSQRHGKYKTRRSSQSLLSVESSESDASDIRQGQEQKSKKAESQILVSDLIANVPVGDTLGSVLGVEDVNIPLISTDDFEKDPKGCLDIKLHEDGVLTTECPVIKSDISNAEPSEVKQQSDESNMQNDCHKVELITATIEEGPAEEEAVISLQNSLVLPEKVELKTPELHRCPHTKRGRGRRRSTSCNCLLGRSSMCPQESICNDSHVSQDLEDKNTLEPVSLLSESDLDIIKPVLIENEYVALVDNCSVDNNEQCPPALPNSTNTEMPTNNPVKNLDEAPSLLSVIKGPTQEDKKENTEDKHQEKEPNGSASDNTSDQDQPQSSSPQDDSLIRSKPVVDKTVRQEQLECPIYQDEVTDMAVNENVEKLEMPEKEALGHGIGGDIISISEGTELDGSSHLEGDDGEETQLGNTELQPKTDEYCEAILPLHSAMTETCLDSPPKQKSSDYCRDEVGQSPNSSVTRGVWSPSASPSTSILKKGQKRQCEEDSPSPLLKSRRVSFANPIYQQEMADDIDRRSPVIRTSSPRSKAIGQPKYIPTPTKGLLTLSPRNLRSPGYKSSKKCLISEMNQEPRPIPKDCVYPALVSCSTPVEAVLPQISSNMWPRGFGQLVRARNIKTVGDLSALTSDEIKMLPIRSPKLSNVRKALKTYHEQQRKGRSDDLKCFDETEKMTSEPEEMDTPSNPDEEQISRDVKEIVCPDVPSALEQKLQEPLCVELLSDMVALGARLTNEELSHCSPSELGRMHEHLSGMMRSIVDHLQSRLVNLEDSLP